MAEESSEVVEPNAAVFGAFRNLFLACGAFTTAGIDPREDLEVDGVSEVETPQILRGDVSDVADERLLMARRGLRGWDVSVDGIGLRRPGLTSGVPALKLDTSDTDDSTGNNCSRVNIVGS